MFLKVVEWIEAYCQEAGQRHWLHMEMIWFGSIQSLLNVDNSDRQKQCFVVERLHTYGTSQYSTTYCTYIDLKYLTTAESEINIGAWSTAMRRKKSTILYLHGRTAVLEINIAA